jgi:AraC family ethanolamine operon transcriptional activator
MLLHHDPRSKRRYVSHAHIHVQSEVWIRPALNRVADLEAMSAAVQDGLDVEYVQLEAGAFAGWWSVRPLASISLQVGGADVSLVRRIRIPDDAWMFAVPVAMPSPARWNGCAVDAGEVITVPPGSRTYVFDPAGSRYAIVVLRGAALTALPDGQPPENSVVIRPGLSHMQALRRALFRAMDTEEGTVRGVHAADRERALLASMADCLASSRQPVPRQSARSEIVARSEDFVWRHAGENVTIAQLSAASGVSERSLRNAFYDVCDVGPKRYLRIRSLHHVRRALSDRAAAGASVTDVATYHGFFELGRFAGEYKALFGEAPSETLQKAKARVAAADLSRPSFATA